MTKRIDRVIPGVGRIARASGTTDGKTYKRITSMLSGLANIGKLDVLKGLQDGDYTFLTVLHFWERGQLQQLPSKATAGGLVAALEKYRDSLDCSTSYRANLGTSVRRVTALAKKGASVNDLPKILRAAKDTMRDTPVAFNRFRSQMLAFVSETQGKHSPLWIDVLNVNRFRKVEGKRPHKLLRRPLTVAELDAVCAAFVDYEVYGGKRGGGRALRRTIRGADLAAMAFTLATTGMRPQEYWQRKKAKWTVRPDHVWIDGTKTAASVRPSFWNWFDHTTRPVCAEGFYRERFADATTKALREGLDLYSLRRTFAKLCEDAGVVESRRESYMGHGPANVGALYLKTHVLPFVHQDAERVASWMKSERERAAARPTLKLEALR